MTATGAIERPLSFAGNDVPGVMLAASMRDYVVNWGVTRARRSSSPPTTMTLIVLPSRCMKQASRLSVCWTPAKAAAAIWPTRSARLASALSVARHCQGQGRQTRHQGRHLRSERRGRCPRGNRSRCGGDVRRLVAGGAPVVPLRWQADLG